MKHAAWLGLLLLIPGLRATAQDPVLLRGRVLAGQTPVPGQAVALHRVTATGGQTLAADTTEADGSFSLSTDSLSRTGVHFVATRFDGKFYIGDTFRTELPEEYVLRVGPGATPLNLEPALPVPAAAPEPESRTAGILVVLLALLGLAGIIGLAARPRTSPVRQILVEIADLDIRNEATPLPHYSQQRAELMQRLRESA